MIALIPARGGSKGLPGKNTKCLAGKPLIAYTIEAATASKYVTEVIVSTDSCEIEQVAIKYGAKSPFLRPKELAEDHSLAIDNYKYTVQRLSKEFGYLTDSFVVLQPTSPLRTSKDIDSAIEIFREKNADSVVSFVEESHPIHWNTYIDEDGRLESLNGFVANNRQHYKPSFYPNGAIYVFSQKLIFSNRYFSENSYAYVMPRERSVDIDSIEDFQYAEFVLRKNCET
ncbi:MAG: acylneuraminate cytidylyltransferase family protein [Gammaproteobacteria bacterium]|nr:acylneuraminate cytidylyltransferase family protein [Gammaproteobacteria bacterium]